jgi:type II secretory pathway pseudopilin PulG
MRFSAILPAGFRRFNRSAFTLVEMMFSVGVYTVLLVGAVLAIQVFALRVYTLAATKLSATATSRQALNQIRDDIRGGKYVLVGSANNSGTFTPYAGTNLASGNAMEVFAATNCMNSNGVWCLPPYNLYYLQTNTPGGVSSNNLIWTSVVTTNSSTTVLATYITNLDVFASMDWESNASGIFLAISSNNVYNDWIYTVKLQFYQWEYPIAIISSNSAANAYDYYQLRTRISRRSLN